MTLAEIVAKSLENRKNGPNTSENWYATFTRGEGHVEEPRVWLLNAWNDVVPANRTGNYAALSADDLLSTNWCFVTEKTV